MTYFKQCNFVCLSFFWVARNEKKRFPFAWKKQQLLFLLVFRFFFFIFVRKKKFVFCLALNKEKRNSNFFYLFLLFFFASNYDNWWQVGRWYGITNLVLTWWHGWVVVTKCSKCCWRHIEMVPKGNLILDKIFQCNISYYLQKTCNLCIFSNSNLDRIFH